MAREHFAWLSGLEKLQAFEILARQAPGLLLDLRHPSVADLPAEPHVILRVATLDEDPGSVPSIHIWRSHEVPWCAYEGDIARFENGRRDGPDFQPCSHIGNMR